MSHTAYKLLTNDSFAPDEVVELHQFYVSPMDRKLIADVTIRIADHDELRLGLPADRLNIEAVPA